MRANGPKKIAAKFISTESSLQDLGKETFFLTLYADDFLDSNKNEVQNLYSKMAERYRKLMVISENK